MRIDKGVLVTAAILAVFVAAIAVPNLLEALDRSAQKRTMSDIRKIATAWEARAADTHSYSAGPDPNTNRRDEMGRFDRTHVVAAADLKRALEPQYLADMPELDGWESAFEFRTGNYENGKAKSYAIRTLGKDRKADTQRYAGKVITSFEHDLVYIDGSWFEYPEGM